MDVNGSVAPHDHDYYEICMVHSGTALHRTEHDDRPLNEGSLVVMAPGQTHAFVDAKDFRVTNIYYLAEWLLSDLRSFWDQDGLVQLFLAASLFRRPRAELPIPQFAITGADWNSCKRELDDVQRELGTEAPSVPYLRAALLKFMITVSRVYAREDTTRKLGFSFRREVWMTLDVIEEAIRQSLPFRLAETADQCGITADHLSHIFKESVGYSPMDYFQRRRIQHACTWLLNPRHSITDIALALGFSDAAHFSRLFHRNQGLSPRDYRRMYRTPA